ncbi:MAG: DMT family transporter [Pseudomonadota bacterium]
MSLNSSPGIKSGRIVGAVMLSMTLIVIGDAAGKMLTQAGAAPFFVAWTRFALAAVLLAPLCGWQPGDLKSLTDWRLWLRALLIICAISAILTALKTEPIANVFGGFFIGPIVAYFLSALVLKERISHTRTLLLGLSFIGVLLVVKPGFGMTTGMLFAVLAGCFHGSYLVATRWLAGTFRPRFLLLSQLVIGGLVLLLPSLATGWPSLDAPGYGLVVISALGSAFGNYLLVLINRDTPASIVAPLIYTQLLSATLVGYLVFADLPDTLSLVGLVVIMVTGLSALWFAQRGR